jgi:hypothetical protein
MAARRCRAIALIRARHMETPFPQAVFQIVLGGVIVLAVWLLIGAAASRHDFLGIFLAANQILLCHKMSRLRH